jgi:hypothetical protein
VSWGRGIDLERGVRLCSVVRGGTSDVAAMTLSQKGSGLVNDELAIVTLADDIANAPSSETKKDAFALPSNKVSKRLGDVILIF